MGCENQTDYSIREVEHKTGVKSVTLRAWQRRYGLLNPKRSDKGHRIYSAADIERIELILYWLARGVSIGKVRGLIEQESKQPPAEREPSEEAELLQQLLAKGQLTKARGQLQEAFKLYPFDLAEQRLVKPLTQLLDVDELPLAEVQCSAWRAMLFNQYAFLLQKAAESTLPSALLLSLQPPGELQSWQTAARLASMGYQVQLLDGFKLVDKSSITWLAAQPVQRLALFANQRIGHRGLDLLTELFHGCEAPPLVFGEAGRIHRDDWRACGATVFTD